MAAPAQAAALAGVRAPGPVPTPTPSPRAPSTPDCCTTTRTAVAKFCGTLIETETINKTAKVGVSTISLAGAFCAIGSGLKAFKDVLKTCVAWLDVTEVIKRVQEWVSPSARKGWSMLKTMSRISLTVFHTIGAIKFFEEIKLLKPYFSNLTNKLACIPVIGQVPFLFWGLASYTLSLVDNIFVSSNKSKKVDLFAARREIAEIKKEILSLDAQKIGGGSEIKDLHDRYKNAVENLQNAKIALGKNGLHDGPLLTRIQQITGEMTILVKSRASAAIDTAKALQEKRFKHFKAHEYNATLERSKARVGLLNDLFKVALFVGILGSMFLASTVAAAWLSPVALPMLVLSLATAAMGVVKVFSDKRETEKVSKKFVP